MKFIVILALELPFWVPFKSGKYRLPRNREIILRNDFWEVSIGNTVDGPYDIPFTYIVNEDQVTDDKFLGHITAGKARYFHKEKMKTTFTRVYTIKLKPGYEITGKPGSEEWAEQVSRTSLSLIGEIQYQEFLADINEFIDYSVTTVSGLKGATEIRRVSFYDTFIRFFVIIRKNKMQASYSTRVSPDFKGAEQPFPLQRICSEQLLSDFKATIETLEPPDFHQIQWAMAVNRLREYRYQEALLCADLVLEALIFRYYEHEGKTRNEIKTLISQVRGRANLVRSLTSFPEPYRENVAKMRDLRNEVVHEQKSLAQSEYAIITQGIRSLGKLREFLFQTTNPTLLELEQKFSSFLEGVPLQAVSQPVMRMIPISKAWRREKDCWAPQAVKE